MRELFLTICTVFTICSYAEGPEYVVDELRQQLELLQSRIELLEKERDSLKTLNVKASTQPLEISNAVEGKVARSTERISFKGDFRYRYEYIDTESKSHRDRDRIRLRLNAKSKVTDDIRVGIGLASGGDDPVSTNQSLGKGGSTKDLRLDMAYVNWDFYPGGQILAGKFANPLYRPQKSTLLWDGDWRPEGLAMMWKGDSFFANAIANWLESDSKSDNRSMLLGFQLGGSMNLGNVDINGAIGYFDFPTEGKRPFYENDFNGNTFTDEQYSFDYKLIEFGADIRFSMLNQPASLYTNYVHNRESVEDSDGWLIGFGFGKVKEAKSWSVKYQYRDLESDAVLGLVSDSDFGGGDTGVHGHIFSGKVGVAKNWSLGFTWFIENRMDVGDQGLSRQYDRLQIDTQFKF